MTLRPKVKEDLPVVAAAAVELVLAPRRVGLVLHVDDLNEKGVRLAQNMEVGSCTPVGTQL